MASPQTGRLILSIQAGLINHMSNLPKYYFQDIPAEVMKEMMDEMRAVKPETDIEETDDWLNRHIVPSTIPQ